MSSLRLLGRDEEEEEEEEEEGRSASTPCSNRGEGGNTQKAVLEDSIVTQPNFDDLVSPTKFDHLHKFYTNGRI